MLFDFRVAVTTTRPYPAFDGGGPHADSSVAMQPAVQAAYAEMVRAGVAHRRRAYLEPSTDPAWLAHCDNLSRAAFAAEGASGSHSAVCAPPTLDEEITEVLADGPAPLDLGPLSPAELDGAVEAALASPTATDVAVAPSQPSAAAADITEIQPAVTRGRGESMKRRKRSRKPGDHRHKA